MKATDLASYAITGSRPIWPLLLVLGLLVLLVTGLVVAQVTDPDRKRRAADRQAHIAGAPAAAEPAAEAPAAEAPQDGPGAPDVDAPEQHGDTD